MTGRKDDWDELFLRYLGGEADAELERRVRERLLSDESARARLVSLACQQQALVDVLGEAAGKPAARPTSLLRRGWMLAAAAVAIAVAGYLLTRPAAEPRIVPPAPKREARAPEKVRPPDPPKAPELPPPPPSPAPEPPKPEKKETIEPAPAPKPVLPEPAPPKPEPAPAPPAPAPKPEPSPRVVTESAVATIDRVEGEVMLLSAEGRVAAAAKQLIRPGNGLETAAGGLVEISYPDGTRVRLEPATVVKEITDGDKKGKRFFLAKGGVWAEVRKQPADQPMILATPNGEAKVLGTRLRLFFDEKESTRLEVEEGKVRLKRLADGKFADVSSGFFAVAAAGGELKPLPAILLGLVGNWRFEEAGGARVADVSGLGNHGVITGNTRRVLGKFGQALEMDGASVVNIPHTPALNPDRSPWSVAAWVRKSDEYHTTVVFKDDDGKFRSYYYLSAIAKPRFEFSTGDAKVTLEGKTSVNDGKWHHVAGVRTAPYAGQLYVDGVLEASGTVPPSPSSSIWSSSPLKIGSSTAVASGLGPWKGSLDDVRVYSRALSADEVRQLFLGR